MNKIIPTNFDFNEIRETLKTQLESNPKFTDWDFEGSGLSVILDSLAYSVHMNALSNHVMLNEAFLTSAQLRNNVVAHAKMLNYIPRSRIAPTAIINLTLQTTLSSGSYTLPVRTKFETVNDGQRLSFYTVNSASATVEANGTVTFNDLIIREGELKTVSYINDDGLFNQRFLIPDKNVDITTLVVEADSIEFTPYTDLSSLDGTSSVYFIQENVNENYEVYFGDGNIGRKPDNGATIELSYLSTSGDTGNGSRVFRLVSTLPNAPSNNVTSVQRARGGLEREGIESIRKNAPVSFVTQNRAITPDDYISIIRRDFGEVDAISVWGGETLSPPQYGKVFISVKPKYGDKLTDPDKATVKSILKRKNVITVVPDFVDPDYTFINLGVSYRYNPRIIQLSESTINGIITTEINTYNQSLLSSFESVYRTSVITNLIDETDPGILSSFISTKMYKDVELVGGNNTNTLRVNFVAPFRIENSTDRFLVNPVVYTEYGTEYELIDVYETAYIRRLRRKRTSTGVVNNNLDVGYIDLAKGDIYLTNIRPDVNTTIRLMIEPGSKDIASRRNSLINIAQLSFNPIVDTIAFRGSSGAEDFYN